MTNPDLPTFYYANGTTFASQIFGYNLFPGGDTRHVPGLNGQFHAWNGALIEDPFPLLLDETLWQYKRVQYSASIIGMGISIATGIDWVVNQILLTDPGTPFALGGYSQGAAVAMGVYDQCRQGRLASRRQDCRAVVTFGSPVRETNHLWVGSSGYNGAFDVPQSLTNSHGLFPTRVQNTEQLVWDFVMPNDVITAVGDSPIGLAWSREAGELLAGRLLTALIAAFDLALSTLFGQVGQALAAAAANWTAIDPVTGLSRIEPGGGHTQYPFLPPPNADGSAGSGDTCYQIAANYLNRIGAQIYDQMHPTVPAPLTPPTYSWSSTW